MFGSNKWMFVVVMFPFINMAQSYAPAPGQQGSTAVHKDSSLIVGWANTCEVDRGYLNIDSIHLGTVDFGMPSNAVGPAEGTVQGTVSLGDGGQATLHFFPPIANGPGPDFAVFENGFADHYMELAFVEVSSDGINYVRFPAYSETPTNVQLSNASYSDCRYVHNLAGKYRAGFGTPFDLEDLIDSVGLDLSSIAYVRIIDCVGQIEGNHVSYDSQQRPINDPFPTAFSSGGFDLDGIAILNAGEMGLHQERMSILEVNNPFDAKLKVKSEGGVEISIHDLLGRLYWNGNVTSGASTISTYEWPAGVYVLRAFVNDQAQSIRLVKP